MNNFDIELALKQFPPKNICDEWERCVDIADREARDMCCEECDVYRQLVEAETGGSKG